MKAHIFLLAATILLASPAKLTASNVELGTIEQPINLAAHSDPSAIPLGSVVYEANYNYGIHTLITAPRPCRHGAMEWSGGTELNQNLANVFGILVEPEDVTMVPFSPVNIRIKAWKKPAYSPYSKEQVLKATLHCLLRSTGATPKNPLNIKIVAEDPQDLKWAKKYEKEYINLDNNGRPAAKPTPIPKTSLITDVRGITYVKFDDVKPLPKNKISQPVMIASPMSGADGEDSLCVIIPVWTGTTWKKPLSVITQQCGLYHDLFYPAASQLHDANVLVNKHPHFYCRSDQGNKKTNMYFMIMGDISEKDLAAALYAVVVTVQPTQEKPLVINLSQSGGKLNQLKSFRADKAWKETVRGNGGAIECNISLDAKTGKLTTGSIPLYERMPRIGNSAIRIRATSTSE